MTRPTTKSLFGNNLVRGVGIATMAFVFGCGNSGGGPPSPRAANSGEIGNTASSGITGSPGGSGGNTGTGQSGTSGTGQSGASQSGSAGQGGTSGGNGGSVGDAGESGDDAENAGGAFGVGTAGAASGAAGGTSGADDGGPQAAVDASSRDGGGAAPGVRIVGRTAPATGGGTRFSWPGVSINAQFVGTQVTMNFADGSNQNRYTVVVDGAAQKTITAASGQTSLTLASNLANGTHSLVVWRNTEASIGVTTFMSLSNFGSGGALLAPLAAPDRRIEVIGDSLSVGAGVLGTSTTCNPGIDAFTDNYLAYGTVAARTVSADVTTIAWSGIGVYRSYGGTAPTMPQRYDYAIPNDNTAWDFTKYTPNVVVINLGTNDFSSGNPGQPYVDAYVAFIKHVRSKYATANMILIDMYGGDRLTAINSVISTLKSGGETKVEELSFSAVPNNNTACNGHPNVAAQQAMGNILSTRLKSLMGW